MRIGVVTETKSDERRVALTPAGTDELVAAGHTVLVQQGAGDGSGFADDAYKRAGAVLVAGAETIWGDVDLLVKVKEPVGPELGYFREDLVIFTYLHLAAAPELTAALLASGATGVAYETVEDAAGRLPLLAPMSEIAGRLAGQVVAHYLQSPMGGRGILAGGAPAWRRRGCSCWAVGWWVSTPHVWPRGSGQMSRSSSAPTTGSVTWTTASRGRCAV